MPDNSQIQPEDALPFPSDGVSAALYLEYLKARLRESNRSLLWAKRMVEYANGISVTARYVTATPQSPLDRLQHASSAVLVAAREYRASLLADIPRLKEEITEREDA